jgi:membrane protease subunit (stomatin/prohibitin family)
MLDKMRGILEVIEYLDPTGQEIVHRVPEGGSGEIVLGSQLVVRENQVAVFFRDGRALDVIGPGRHTLTTLNIPFLISYLKIPFGSKSPFRAEVVFVNLKDYIDLPWTSAQPIPFRDPDLGMVRLTTEGKFAFNVGQAQQFVNQVVGTQGLFGTKDIVGYLRSIINTRLSDVIGELHSSVLDLPTRYDELSAAVQAKVAVDFEALGLKIKAVFVTAINVPPEVEKAMDERASMGAIGNMQAYLQFKAARAIGDMAQNPGSGNNVAGLGVSLGAGLGLGATMASAIGGAFGGAGGAGAGSASSAPGAGGGPAGGGNAPAGGGAGLADQFSVLTALVQQQISLSVDDRAAAATGLSSLQGLLNSATTTMDEFRTSRNSLTSRFPWLAEPVNTLLNTPAGLQALGRISTRSL